MLSALDRRFDFGGDWLLLAGRLLLSLIFLHEAAVLLTGFPSAAAAMAKAGVPAAVLAATLLLQAVAGAMLALGWHGRIGAFALGLFCVATAFAFHLNFAVRNELLHFEKDLAIAGGMFALAALGTGRLSVDRGA